MWSFLQMIYHSLLVVTEQQEGDNKRGLDSQKAFPKEWLCLSSPLNVEPLQLWFHLIDNVDCNVYINVKNYDFYGKWQNYGKYSCTIQLYSGNR